MLPYMDVIRCLQVVKQLTVVYIYIDPTQLQVIKVTTPAQNPPSTSWFVNVSWPKIMEAMSKFGQKTISGCL